MRVLALAGVVATAGLTRAQVPNPIRAMLPAIAPAPGLVLPSGPLFATADGQWNHGDGFAPVGQADADYSGWRSPDDGQGLEITDVHVHSGQNLDVAWPSSTPVWEDFVWNSYVWTGGPVTMRRLEGHLRPLKTTAC